MFVFVLLRGARRAEAVEIGFGVLEFVVVVPLDVLLRGIGKNGCKGRVLAAGTAISR